MYVCIYMYVCVHICMCTHTHTHTKHIYTQALPKTHKYITHTQTKQKDIEFALRSKYIYSVFGI